MWRRLAFGLVCGLSLAAVGGLVVPRRYVVEGVSMAPGLRPGDRVATGWLPPSDRWRRPRRFERWTLTLPDGTVGLKRIVGLPGEMISIGDGDLAAAGAPILKSPRLLAAMGSPTTTHGALGADATAWTLPPTTLLDETEFTALEAARLLLPVRDAGVAAVLDAVADARVRVGVGPVVVTWRIGRTGRHAVVAGRLDGHAVAVAWPLSEPLAMSAMRRGCLPPDAPDRWDVAVPWPTTAATAGSDKRAIEPEPHGRGPVDDVERSPPLALEIEQPAGGQRCRIEEVHVWRDGLYRPAADGVTSWTLAAGEIFALGDFPSGSRDSRHFGPLRIETLRHPIANHATGSR